MVHGAVEVRHMSHMQEGEHTVDSIAIDTTADGVPDHILSLAREGDVQSGSAGCRLLKTVVVVVTVAVLCAAVIAELEGVALALALNTVVNALFTNGDGRHEVKQPVSRLLLVFVSLLGFFLFIEGVQGVVPWALGVVDEPTLRPRLTQIRGSGGCSEEDDASDDEVEGVADGETELLALERGASDSRGLQRKSSLRRATAVLVPSSDSDGTRASARAGARVAAPKQPLSWRALLSSDADRVAGVRRARLFRALLWWAALMSAMVLAHLHDNGALDRGGALSFDRASEALLFAVSTGCSGGFGSLSSDVLGAICIAVAIPSTAFLAAEVAAWRKSGTPRLLL